MGDSNQLWQEILKFSKDKNKIALGFIFLGLIGLVLPIIPGILLLMLGLLLIKPK